MKKIIFLSILSILCIRCSDNELNNLENGNQIKIETQSLVSKSVENNIDSLFYNYVNSVEYKESNRLIHIFLNKIKVPVTADDFNTKAEMFEWIGLNLNKTDFVSLEEAQAECLPISNLIETTFINNQELFEFIGVSDPEIVTFYSEKWMLNTTTEDDHCTKQIKTCEANALAAFLHLVLSYRGSSESAAAYEDAQWAFGRSMTVCANNFEACVAAS